tara:strand:- start:666 stop:902 length:237 start_codon:yes stop_codon:yes gene_type:complete
MRPFSFYINESFISQIKYYIVSHYGESEYQSILDANPIALIDGIVQLTITTQEKPQNTTPTSLKSTTNGWVSTYKKLI